MLLTKNQIKYIVIVRGKIGEKSLNICLKEIEIVLIFDCDKKASDWGKFISESIELSKKNDIFLLNLWGNKIIPESLINCLSGSLNLHPGLLPGQAGSHTITHALINEEICGASINRIDKKLDFGKVLVDCCSIDGNKLLPAWQIRKDLQESLLMMLESNLTWILDLIDDNQLEERKYGLYNPTRSNQIILDKKRDIESFSNPRDFLNWIAAHDFCIENSSGVISYKNSNGKRQSIGVCIKDIQFDM